MVSISNFHPYERQTSNHTGENRSDQEQLYKKILEQSVKYWNPYYDFSDMSQREWITERMMNEFEALLQLPRDSYPLANPDEAACFLTKILAFIKNYPDFRETFVFRISELIFKYNHQLQLIIEKEAPMRIFTWHDLGRGEVHLGILQSLFLIGMRAPKFPKFKSAADRHKQVLKKIFDRPKCFARNAPTSEIFGLKFSNESLEFFRFVDYFCQSSTLRPFFYSLVNFCLARVCDRDFFDSVDRIEELRFMWEIRKTSSVFLFLKHLMKMR